MTETKSAGYTAEPTFRPNFNDRKHHQPEADAGKSSEKDVVLHDAVLPCRVHGLYSLSVVRARTVWSAAGRHAAAIRTASGGRRRRRLPLRCPGYGWRLRLLRGHEVITWTPPGREINEDVEKLAHIDDVPLRPTGLQNIFPCSIPGTSCTASFVTCRT